MQYTSHDELRCHVDIYSNLYGFDCLQGSHHKKKNTWILFFSLVYLFIYFLAFFFKKKLYLDSTRSNFNTLNISSSITHQPSYPLIG